MSEDGWMAFPENAPDVGWCAVSDGGWIDLAFWGGTEWNMRNCCNDAEAIIEFKQVTTGVRLE